MGAVESVFAEQPDPHLEDYLQQIYRECGYSRYPRYPLQTPRFGSMEILPVQDHRFLIRKTYMYLDARSLLELQAPKIPEIAPVLGVEARVHHQLGKRHFEVNIYFEYPIFMLNDYVQMLKQRGNQPMKADELMRILKIGVACIAHYSKTNEVHGDM